MKSCLELLLELLRIESITGNEAVLSRFVEKRLAEVNRDLQITRLHDSLIITGPYHPNRETIGLFGHLDTVPGVETGEQVRVEDEKVFGLGASDMKSGVAVILRLLHPDILNSSNYNIVAVLYHGEEGPNDANGIHLVLKEGKEQLSSIDFAFVLEPTANDLHLGCVGSLRAKIFFEGKQAHSARPWEGMNAIHEGSDTLARLSAFPPKLIKCGGLEFMEVISVTKASGGIAFNLVPDLFGLWISYRFAPDKSASEAEAFFKDNFGAHGKFEVLSIAPASLPPTENKILTSFTERFKLEHYPKQATTDVAHLALAGIDAVNFGPGLPAQAHQRGEYVPLANVERSLDTLQLFLTGK